MKITFLFLGFLIAHSIFGQRTFHNLILDSQKSQKLILVNVQIPEREPALSLMDPIDMSINVCYDGGCTERILKNFEVENYLMADENAKMLISKYNLTHLPITLIFDNQGNIITKCNSYLFGNEEKLKVVLPILTNKSTAENLRLIEQKMQSASIVELKDFMVVKDSLSMADSDMIDLFVQKATEKDYDQRSQDLILKFTQFVNTDNEYRILENLYKYSKNYVSKDDEEIQQYKLQEDYKHSLFMTLFYAYRTKDDKLFFDKIDEAKTSNIKGDEIDILIKGVAYLYFKSTNRPEELFAIVRPDIEKQISVFNSPSKKASEKSEPISKETLAEDLNKIAYSYYEAGGKNLENLKTALAWSKKSVTFMPEEPSYLDTYAHLLYVTGNKNEAILKQKQALAMTKNMYKAQLDDPSVKEFISTMEVELSKMVEGKL